MMQRHSNGWIHKRMADLCLAAKEPVSRRIRATVLWAGFALVATPTLAGVYAPAEMAQRHRDVRRCMEQSLGKRWEQRFGIDMAVNRWGEVEAVGTSIDSAPQAVRLIDLRCRRETDLAGQPRASLSFATAGVTAAAQR